MFMFFFSSINVFIILNLAFTKSDLKKVLFKTIFNSVLIQMLKFQKRGFFIYIISKLYENKSALHIK